MKMKSRGTLEHPRSLGPHFLAIDRPVKKGLAPTSVWKGVSKNEYGEGQNRRPQSADWVTLGD